MANNRQSITDGENYLSRSRVNRHVITLTGESPNQLVPLNGKVSKVVVDASDASLDVGSGNTGELKFLMDIEDGSATEIPYFDTIGKLNYTGAGSGQVALLEVTPGSNKGTASAKNSLHFSVTTTTAAESGGVAINEPAAWNGLVCGQVRVFADVDPGSGTVLAPASVIRVIIFME
jgi:hypothetical protein